jgi:hypothetical protein
MLRDVVASVARQAGCEEADAATFGQRVEEAAHGAASSADANVEVVVRQGDGVTEVRLGSGADVRSLSVRA